GLDNVRSRMILPVLNRCATCGKASGASHRNEEHEHKRDETMPRWHGWHAFRRGVATDLQKAGIKVAQGGLRHSDPGVTMRSYAKTVPDDLRSAIEERSAKLAISLTDTSRTPEIPSAAELKAVN